MAKLHSITRHGAHMIKINQAFLCALLAPHPYCIIRKSLGLRLAAWYCITSNQWFPNTTMYSESLPDTILILIKYLTLHRWSLVTVHLAIFLHPSWRAKPASWGVLRLFWVTCVYIYIYIYIYIYMYVCTHHNA